MNNVEQINGIISAPVVPFDNNLAVDYEGFRNVVRDLLNLGVSGLAVSTWHGEGDQLTWEESLSLLKAAVQEAGTSIPVMLEVSCVSAAEAAERAHAAEAAGASIIIITPPVAAPLPFEDIVAGITAIHNATQVPLILHSRNEAPGVIVDIKTGMELLQRFPRISHVWEESRFPLEGVAAYARFFKDRPGGVFSGHQGQHIILDHGRGASGNISGSAFAAMLLKVWKYLDDGKTEKAEELFGEYVELVYYSWKYPVLVEKEILRRRGLIQNANLRLPKGVRLDEENTKELNWMLEAISER